MKSSCGVSTLLVNTIFSCSAPCGKLERHKIMTLIYLSLKVVLAGLLVFRLIQCAAPNLPELKPLPDVPANPKRPTCFMAYGDSQTLAAN